LGQEQSLGQTTWWMDKMQRRRKFPKRRTEWCLGCGTAGSYG
jgi:hypothetical protein